MAEPKISLNNLRRWPKCLIIVLPALALSAAVVLSFFKSCTSLGSVAKNDIYNPSECGAGFVNKADSVLDQLLRQVDTSHNAVSLDSLNARYKALEFALPYGEEDKPYIEACDIRLVAIHPEFITDESLKDFYYNSRLPQLLEQQAEHPGETYFSIKCIGLDTLVNGRRPIKITSIKMIPSLFKVALEKNPWTGIIDCKENCLFAGESTVYLTYGNTVLPLHQDSHFANQGSVDETVFFQAILNEGLLLWMPQRSSNRPVDMDYYSYQKKAFGHNTNPHAIRIGMYKSRRSDELAHVTLSLSHDTLRMFHDDCGLSLVRSNEREELLRQVKAGEVSEVPFEDGMKILVYAMRENVLSEKVCEFTLYKNNPSLQLSRLVQSSTGTSRYFISEYQTDLFTQQLLRGLSQHLSNRENIDTVHLSIDPLLSREFENDIKQYVRYLQRKKKDSYGNTKPSTHYKEQYDMSVTIMDMATGEVLATPFYTTQFDKNDFPGQLKLTTRNTSLVRRSVGSTFKPMAALASVLAVPSLLDLNTTTHGYSVPNWNENTVTFFGRKTTPWAKGPDKNPNKHWGGCDFQTFLSRSDDVYPVALVAFALSGKDAVNGTSLLPVSPGSSDSFFEMRNSRLVFKKTSNWKTLDDNSSQRFIYNMSLLYDLPGNDRNIDARYERTTDINPFRDLMTDVPENEKDDKCCGLQDASPDPTQLRMNRFYDGEDFRALLVPWTLGQGDNMWNCIKIAEAWARMVGKRDVQASFLHNVANGDRESILSLRGGPMSYNTHANLNTTWNTFLDKFNAAQAQSGGTLKKMYDRLNQVAPDLRLFSKTGTPDAYVRYEFPMLGGNNRFIDVGMYTFALVKDTSFERIKRNQKAKGIVCVVRITRSYECSSCKRLSPKKRPCAACKAYWGIDSSMARDFFADNSNNHLQKLIDMTYNYIYEPGQVPSAAQACENNQPAAKPAAKKAEKPATPAKTKAKPATKSKPAANKSSTTKKSGTTKNSKKKK